jgi:hypothetical protein
MNRFDLFCVDSRHGAAHAHRGEAQRILAHVRSCSRADKLIVAELGPRHQPWSADNGGIGAGVRGPLLFHLAVFHLKLVQEGVSPEREHASGRSILVALPTGILASRALPPAICGALENGGFSAAD